MHYIVGTNAESSHSFARRAIPSVKLADVLFVTYYEQLEGLEFSEEDKFYILKHVDENLIRGIAQTVASRGFQLNDLTVYQPSVLDVWA